MVDRPKTPTAKGPHGFEAGPTKLDSPRARVAATTEDEKTAVFDPPKPGEPDFVREASTPIRVKSMKTPGQVSSGEIPLPPDVARPQHQVKLRAISEVASQSQRPQLALGYLAPPRDPKEVRSRRRGELVIWGSVAVMIACAIALGIWFLAK